MVVVLTFETRSKMFTMMNKTYASDVKYRMHISKITPLGKCEKQTNCFDKQIEMYQKMKHFVLIIK